jgi:hypothetical protein
VQPYSSESIRSFAGFLKIISNENNYLVIYYEKFIVVGSFFMSDNALFFLQQAHRRKCPGFQDVIPF